MSTSTWMESLLFLASNSPTKNGNTFLFIREVLIIQNQIQSNDIITISMILLDHKNLKSFNVPWT